MGNVYKPGDVVVTAKGQTVTLRSDFPTSTWLFYDGRNFCWRTNGVSATDRTDDTFGPIIGYAPAHPVQAAQPEAVGLKITKDMQRFLLAGAQAGDFEIRLAIYHFIEDQNTAITSLRAQLTARVTALSAQVDQLTQANMVLVQEHAGAVAERDATFYIDCEFDGHDGPLLSIAVVRYDGYSLHVLVDAKARDPWVIANVIPIMHQHNADKSILVVPDHVGTALRDFIGDCDSPTIIADSPVDIGRFCRAISTGVDGGWTSLGYSRMSFIVRNIDCYPTDLPGAVQHNAWWDAMALRFAIRARSTPPSGADTVGAGE